MKRIILMCIPFTVLLAQTPQVTKEDVDKYINKSAEWKKQLSSVMKGSDSDVNTKEYFKMIETGKDGKFMGKKMATIKLPERTIEEIDDPLKRAETVNEIQVDREAKKIKEKSKNISKLYKFLAMYGKLPEKDGELPNEKKLFELIDKGKLKVKVEKRTQKQTKIKPINHFKKISIVKDKK